MIRKYQKWWIFLFGVTFLSAALFLNFPTIDIAVSNLFYDQNNTFALTKNETVRGLRDFFKFIFAATLVFAVLMAIISPLRRQSMKISSHIWYFIISAYFIGPGVVVNLILKNNWGRARPVYVEQFGGTATFSPPLLISDQCATNCSFVSGETSTIATLTILTCALFWKNASNLVRVCMMSTAFVLTALASFQRVATGRHFFSDTIFSTLFCAMVVLALYQIWRIDQHRGTFSPENIWHDIRALVVFRRK